MSDTKALASFKARIAKNIERAAGSVDKPAGGYVSLKGKVFTFPDGTSYDKPIEVVVLGYVNAFSYFEGVYNPKDPRPPVCWAKGFEIDDMKPSENAPKPQAPSCAECPMNEFGSSPTGGKACKQTYQLAITRPDAEANAPVYVLNVSPTGRKRWSGYIRDLLTKGLDPVQVVTQVSFDPDREYASLLFEAVAQNENLEAMAALYDQAQDMLHREPRTPETA